MESADDWAAWAVAPRPLADDGQPDVSFLPAMQRRRL
ncbi:beta-ketoacyl synthase chain length factor, partial [Stutzerimonas nitrititolerans]